MNSIKAHLLSSRCEKPSDAINAKYLLVLICVLMFAVKAASGQTSQTVNPADNDAAENTSGTISGRVTGEDGRPLADARVTVFRAYSTAGQPQSVATDSEGKFRVKGLSTGLYSFSAWAPGFAQPEVAGDIFGNRFYRLGDSVTLTLVKGGVVTGSVRDVNGQPLVAISVNAIRVRDAEGRRIARVVIYPQRRLTDDRGIYRLYALPPGTYVISAGGSLGFYAWLNAYEDAATYFPSSSRDTAAEVLVRSGEEASGIDIRYRGEKGRFVSGIISGSFETGTSYGISVVLKHALSGEVDSSIFVAPGAKPSFSFSGIADGTYEVTAQQGNSASVGVASISRRVTVRGADVTGIELAMSPLGSVAGRATLEPLPKKEGCAGARSSILPETLIIARREEKTQTSNLPTTPFWLGGGGGGSVTDQGEFAMRNLSAGNYRLIARLPSDFWYVKSISLPAGPPARQPDAPAKRTEVKSTRAMLSVITLRGGENITSVSVNIAQDGASVSGRVVNSKEGAEGGALPMNLRIYAVPSARELEDDVLRYSETTVESDGSFSFTNLAPGRYWLIARSTPEEESPTRIIRPLAWDSQARVKLRLDAEAANTATELKPCQVVEEFVLKYPSAQ